MRVRQLLYAEGFTIAGAKKKLQKSGAEPGEADDPVLLRGEKLRDNLVELRAEVAAFLAELED
jgi:hypothetical protein